MPKRPKQNSDHPHRHNTPTIDNEAMPSAGYAYAKHLEALLTPAVFAQQKYYKQLGLRTLILLDRGFYHFQFLQQLINQEVNFITRLKALRQLADRFQVSKSCVQRLIRTHKNTGEVKAKAHGGGAIAKIKTENLPAVQQLVDEQPDAK